MEWNYVNLFSRHFPPTEESQFLIHLNSGISKMEQGLMLPNWSYHSDKHSPLFTATKQITVKSTPVEAGSKVIKECIFPCWFSLPPSLWVHCIEFVQQREKCSDLFAFAGATASRTEDPGRFGIYQNVTGIIGGKLLPLSVCRTGLLSVKNQFALCIFKSNALCLTFSWMYFVIIFCVWKPF